MHLTCSLRLSMVVLAAGLWGCVSRPSSVDDPGPAGSDMQGVLPMGVALIVTPADVVLKVDGKTPHSVDFHVTRDGQDVARQATLYLDNPKLGSFKGATFTSNPEAVGKSAVRAHLNADTGSASVTLRLSTVVIGPGAPADAPGKFGGPNDPTRAPQIAYPPSGALVPPNLNELEVQFLPNKATLFEIAITSDAMDLRIYTPCVTVGTGCGLAPDEPTWKLLSQAARNTTVQLAVRGTSDGGGVGASAAQPLLFGNDDMQGGLYYWAASAGGVNRYDFGLRGQKAENFYGPLRATAICVGCHALSRNGKRIAVGMNIPGPSAMRTLDVASRNKLFDIPGIPTISGSDFETFTADGEKLITTEGGGLTLRNAADGTQIGQKAAVQNADMPDVSPDNSQIVFARGQGTCLAGVLCVTLSVQGASLFTVPFTGMGFGLPTVVVKSGGENNYYPSFSPDGKYIAFNRAAGDSYDATDAQVMVVPTAGGAPISLAAVNTVGGNSWPKWGPFVQHFQGSTITWITFSSRRDYGLRHTGNSQIWMVPVDSAKLAAGKDPGYPPIWLPFQDPATGNHIAQWVAKVERAPCSVVDQTGCAPTEVCVDGMCVPGIQ